MERGIKWNKYCSKAHCVRLYQCLSYQRRLIRIFIHAFKEKKDDFVDKSNRYNLSDLEQSI